MDLFPIVVAKRKWEASQDFDCSLSHFSTQDLPVTLPAAVQRQVHRRCLRAVETLESSSICWREGFTWCTWSAKCLFYFGWCNPVLRNLSRSCMHTHTEKGNSYKCTTVNQSKQTPPSFSVAELRLGLFYWILTVFKPKRGLTLEQSLFKSRPCTQIFLHLISLHMYL